MNEDDVTLYVTDSRCPDIGVHGRCEFAAGHAQEHRAGEWRWQTQPKTPMANQPRVERETKPREPGCKCLWEEGDSPCPIHGDLSEADLLETAPDPEVEAIVRQIADSPTIPSLSLPWNERYKAELRRAVEAGRAPLLEEVANLKDALERLARGVESAVADARAEVREAYPLAHKIRARARSTR